MREYKVLVAGSRSIDNEPWVHQMLDKLLINAINAPHPPKIVVIQGMAKGPDTFARNWAIKNGHETDDHPADWRTHGKRAGFLRNEEMVDLRPDAAIFFWDGKSRGTLHTMNLVKARNIPHRVLPPKLTT